MSASSLHRESTDSLIHEHVNARTTQNNSFALRCESFNSFIRSQNKFDVEERVNKLRRMRTHITREPFSSVEQISE